MSHNAGSGGPSQQTAASESDALARFRDSMRLDHERWHDGIGYDLDALRAMSAPERRGLEASLTPPTGWRDVEALAALGSTTAADTLREAAMHGAVEIRMAVLRHAPQLVEEADRIKSLVRALRNASLFGGLSEALDEVLDFHPPPILDVLYEGLLTAPGETAYHCAAALATILGAVDSPYDFSLRPLFLQFNTDDVPTRRTAFLTLCTTLGVEGPAKLAAVDHAVAPPTKENP